MKCPKISIYVPVYGVEKYIEKCVRSLFEQTLDDLEYVFVDDCTPDNSFQTLKQVLEEFPARKSQVKIVRHEVNQGVCIARQTGIRHCVGEYIACCEPDDWVETTMYEALYEKAKKTGADMVSCDYYKESESGSQYGVSHYEGPLDSILSDWVKRKYSAYIWSSIMKRELLAEKDTYFPDKSGGIYAEDCVVMCQFLSYIRSYTFIPQAFYHYRIVPGSISHDGSQSDKKRNSLIQKYNWIDAWLQNRYGNKYAQDILVAKLNMKIGWLKNGIPDAFYTEWSEANRDDILKCLPVGGGKKFLLWLAMHRYRTLCDMLIKAYKLIKK